MTQESLWTRSLLAIRRHGLPTVAATYLITCWLVLEVGHVLSVILELPHVTMRLIFWLLVIGFPMAMAWGWTRTAPATDEEITLPETEPAAKAEHAAHQAHGGGHGGGLDPLPVIVGGLTVLFLAVVAATKLFGSGGGEASHNAPAAHSTALPVVAAKAAAPPRNSIAVLAFDSIDEADSQGYFAEGLSEEILNALSSVEAFQVAARSSAFAFKGKSMDARKIAAQLGVAYVLDGNVRRTHNRIRMRIELVDALTGFAIWSESFDRTASDVFAIQQSIAEHVAATLSAKLKLANKPVVSVGGTRNAAAHDFYLRGRQLVDRGGSAADRRTAVTLFDAALALDPGYADAHAARATSLMVLADSLDSTSDFRSMRAAAIAAAKKATELAPQSAEAQAAFAYMLESSQLSFSAAAERYRLAMKTGSGQVPILLSYGVFACGHGDAKAGVAALRKAVTLDPLNPRAYKALAIGQYAARNHVESIAAARQALALSADISNVHALIGKNLIASGDLTSARAEFMQEPVDWSRMTGLAIVAARSGQKKDADALAKALYDKEGESVRYQLAQISAQNGERDAALSALEKALAVRDPGLIELRTDPFFDKLRADPRLIAILNQLYR